MPTAKEDTKDEKEPKGALLLKPTTTVGPNATVLKPRSLVQTKIGGLVLKAPATTEKPALVSKPSAPAPVRSPWATLPPVDKIPPVAINPEQPALPTSHPETDPGPSSNMPPPLPPAMEIAADSFTRSRADGPNGNVGQLYNAQSGRYEPANTGRRASMRKDQNFRPPSVLQRGSRDEQRASNENQSNAPGRIGNQAANSGSQVTSPSSSGDAARRGSISKPLPNGTGDERKGSQHSQALESPATPVFAQTSTMLDPSNQSSNGQATQTTDGQSTTVPIMSQRDDIALQRQSMREKADAAKRRRAEEEEKEEAAKRERIRQKLDALAKKDAEKMQSAKPAEEQPAEQKIVEGEKPEPPIQSPERTKEPASPDAVKNVVSKSPPKPPAVDPSGAPQQYGMIKMHGPVPASLQQHDGSRMHMEKSKLHFTSPNSNKASLSQNAGAAERVPSPLVNGVKHKDQNLDKSPERSQSSVMRESRQQPWSEVPKDQKMLAAWGNQPSSRDTSTGSSVWGAPAQSRSLGNGTFNQTSQRPQQRTQEQFPSPSLAPIGPPKPSTVTRDSRDILKANDLGLPAAIEDIKEINAFPVDETSALSRRLDPIGRPTSADDRQFNSQYGLGQQSRPQFAKFDAKPAGFDQQKSSLTAWGNFHAAAAQEDATRRQQHAAKLIEDVRSGARHEPQMPIMNETWRQVKIDDQTTQRSIINVTRGQNVHGSSQNIQVNNETRESPFLPQVGAAPSLPAGMGRGSRFFPTTVRAGLHPHAQPPPFAPGYRRGSSPPPPDSDFHPVFLRDQAMPRVSLPVVGPKPKVRLPPSMANSSPPSQAAVVEKSVAKNMPQVPTNAPSWQDKFNGLLFGHKKASPEKTFAVPAPPSASNGFSATKEPLHSPAVQASAAVSLPQVEQKLDLSISRTDSKDMAGEEALFLPESGSLPVVLLPAVELHHAFLAARAWKRGPPRPTRLSKEVESVSRDALADNTTFGNGGPMVFIYLLGMKIPKSKTMLPAIGMAKTEHNSPLPQHRPRNYSSGGKPNKPGPKNRQSSGNFNSGSRNASGTTMRNTHSSSNHQSQAQAPHGMVPHAWGSTFVH